MNRRDAVRNLGLISAAIPSSVSATDASANSALDSHLSFFSPCDSSVDWLTDENKPVLSGQTLFRLNGRDNARQRSRFEHLAKAVDVLERPLLDGHALATIDLLDMDAAIADSTLLAGNRLNGYASGLPGSTRPYFQNPALALIAKGAAEKSGALKKKRHAKLAFEDSKDMVANLRAYISARLLLLKTLDEALEGRAPSNGKFTAQVELGRFIKIGTEIGYFSSETASNQR